MAFDEVDPAPAAPLRLEAGLSPSELCPCGTSLGSSGAPLLPPAPGLSTDPDAYAPIGARPGVLLRFEDNNLL